MKAYIKTYPVVFKIMPAKQVYVSNTLNRNSSYDSDKIKYFHSDGSWKTEAAYAESEAWYSSIDEAKKTLEKFNVPYEVVE